VEKLIWCEHCGHEISDTALECPACLKKTKNNELLLKKIGSLSANAAVVLLGPIGVAVAVANAVGNANYNKKLIEIAKKVNAIDYFQMADGDVVQQVLVTKDEFVPVLMYAIESEGISRSDLHSVEIQRGVREKGFFRDKEKTIIHLNLSPSVPDKDVILFSNFSFTSKYEKALAEIAFIKFREYQIQSQ
jgi:hypothetical protein